MSQTKAQLIDNLVQPITGALGSASAPTFSFTSDPNTGLYSPGADQLALTTGGTGRLFIDSTGKIGLGTSAAQVALQLGNYSGNNQIAITSGSASGTGAIYFGDGTGADLYRGYIQYYHVNDSIEIGTASAGRLTVDSLGRVGLGTSSPQTLLNLANVSQQRFNCTSTGNAISFWKDSTPTFAAEVGIGSATGITSALKFDIFNGTSWSTAVNIDSSNRVGIGTTSPVSPFQVKVGTNQNIAINSDGSNARLSCFNDAASASVPLVINGSDIRFTTEGTERVRINSSGEIGINTSSPLSKLGIAYTATGSASDGIRLSDTTNTTVSVLGTTGSSYSYAGVTGHNTLLYGSRDLAICADNANNGIIKFMTGGAERVRITNGGNILLGTTDAAQFSGPGIKINVAALGVIAQVFTTTAAGDTPLTGYSTGDGTYKYYFRGNGGLANYQANNVNLSDEREKKNIEELDSTWDCLKHWELKKFHYNKDADTEAKRYGVIAQQVQQHCPEVVTDWKKTEDEDGNPVMRLGVKEQQMYWMAIKALQEAQIRIETLEAEVTALKAN